MEEEIKEPVDMATFSKELEEIMILYYPGNISEEKNHIRDTSDPDVTVYRFFRLEKEKLLEFIEPYNNKFEYEVLDSNSGEPLVINRISSEKRSLLMFLDIFSSDN